MIFANPILLLALLPWGAVTVWLLGGRRTSVGVPFIELWRADHAVAPKNRFFHPPPVALAAAILAMLLALLAAAGPAVRSGRRGPQLTIILDRGITMSPGQ